MACWAYYPKGEPGKPEPLSEHLLNVALSIMNHSDFTRLTRKIAREYHLDQALISDIIILVGLLHDIGKSVYKYQENPQEGFSGHEVYSTFIINSILEWIGRMDKHGDIGLFSNSLVGRLLLYPILLHHYAQRNDIQSIYNKIAREVTRGDRPQVRIWQDCTSEIRQVLEKIIPRLTTDIGRQIIGILASEIDNGIVQVSTLGRDPFAKMKEVGNEKEWFGIMAVTGLLNEVDGLVASRARGGRA